MKPITAILLLAVVVIGVVFLLVYSVGCSPQAQSFGAPLTETAVTPIGNILAHPEQFQGKAVRIEGKITDECPAGGWFMLRDETGTVYVNLHPSEIAIPQIVGRQVAAQGLVRKEGPQVEVIGKGVTLK